MLNDVIIRPATSDDAEIIATFALIAGGGIFEFLLNDLVPNLSPEQMIYDEIAGCESELSHQYSSLAEVHGEIVGIAHMYSSKMLHVPQPDDKTIVPYERSRHILTPLFQEVIEDSLYLQTLVVSSHYRGKGIGKKLLDHVKNNAKKEHYPSVTLFAWKDNTKAIALYLREGFRIVKHIDIQPAPLLPHEGGMVLMQCDV